MLTDQLKALEAAKARVASLEAELAAERNAVLKALPAQHGFADVESFVAAVYAASGRKPRRGAKGLGRRRRAVITDATRKQVKALVEDGKTGSEIAKTVGISLPSVQNIKRALGLVKKRK